MDVLRESYVTRKISGVVISKFDRIMRSLGSKRIGVSWLTWMGSFSLIWMLELSQMPELRLEMRQG